MVKNEEQGLSDIKAIYVSGAYSHSHAAERHRNIHRAWDISARIWEIPGAYAVCPHCNTQHMDGPVPYEKFMEGDLHQLARCDAIFMLWGWHHSSGAARERDEAIRLGLPVFYQRQWATESEEFYELQEWLKDGTPPSSHCPCGSGLCRQLMVGGKV